MRRKKFDAASYFYLLAGAVFFTGFVLLGWFGFRYMQGVALPSFGFQDRIGKKEKKIECVLRRVVDGACVASADRINPRLVAVMIENSAEAWPLSGLSHASIVYEAPTESNIPRFLAIFPADEPVDKVGPIRSARPYYLDWLSEYGAGTPYFHVGGSPEALDRIVSTVMIDINEMTHGWYFWRASDRDMPHNVYTSRRLWQKAIDDYPAPLGAKAPSGPVRMFTTTTPCSADCTTEIRATFSSPLYVALWRYSTSTDAYDRYQVGEPFRDADGTQIFADTVIIQRVNATVLDDIGRKHIDTVGSGSAIVFRSGFAFVGTWKKDAVASPTRFLDESGKEIPLKGGHIWIEVVPQNGVVSWH